MIIALAGRRIDAPGAETARFPAENTELVSGRLSELFRSEAPSALVCSAACGADLLALDAAGKFGVRRHIILPFERVRFRKTSVTDRPGDWGNLFDKICDEVEREGNLTALENFEDEAKAYSAVTREFLKKAESLRSSVENKEEIITVIVWEGKARDERDETAALAEMAKARNFVVKEILTK